MLLDKMYAFIDMLCNVVIVFVVCFNFKVEGHILKFIVYFCMDDMLLVSMDAVMTALMPYYFSMSLFCAP